MVDGIKYKSTARTCCLECTSNLPTFLIHSLTLLSFSQLLYTSLCIYIHFIFRYTTKLKYLLLNSSRVLAYYYMGSQSKGSVDGVQSDVKVVENMETKKSGVYDLLLRVLCFLLTLTVTIIVAVDKETKAISYASFQFKATAKWEYMSASVFFLVTNAIGCSYAATTMVISTIARSSGNKNLLLMITILDLVISALHFSANGAAAAVGVLGQKGNSHVQWMKVCNVFDAYCRHMTAALVLSIIGSSVFLLLVAHSIFKLHYNRSY